MSRDRIEETRETVALAMVAWKLLHETYYTKTASVSSNLLMDVTPLTRCHTSLVEYCE